MLMGTHAKLLTAHSVHRLVFYDAEGKTGGIAARAFDHGKYHNLQGT